MSNVQLFYDLRLSQFCFMLKVILLFWWNLKTKLRLNRDIYICFFRSEGYNSNPVKNMIMEPSYRDAVEVRVVDQIKKDLFSKAENSVYLPNILTHLLMIAIARLLLIWSSIRQVEKKFEISRPTCFRGNVPSHRW